MIAEGWLSNMTTLNTKKTLKFKPWKEKNTQDSIYTSSCSANIPSITSRYIAYQLQIKGNNEVKKNYTNKWTNISNIYG
jgi:hypothetical protein